MLEYWFGASVLNYGAGLDENGDPFAINGEGTPLDGVTLTLNGADSAQNQTVASSFLTTSGLLPAADYPQFTTEVAANYDRPGGPFSPHTGDFYAYSHIADVSFKRLSHTINVPAGGATMTFWTSYDTELDWDHLFVEAHTVGQDDWTTLPDSNGHTSQATGESCKAENSGGWRTLHPVPRSLPDPERRLGVSADGLDRCLERRLGQLRWLAAVVGRPGRIRGQAGRGVDLVRQRLGEPGSRCLHR